MEIRENDNYYIIAPICNTIDEYKTQRLLEEISRENRKVALDLAYVNNCSIDFIEGISALARKISIFNIPSDIFVLFNIMNIDKELDLYVSELDFIENCRAIINRKFSII